MIDNKPKLDVVRQNYNDHNFEFEVRRLPEECPVEYAMTLRWLDRWIAAGSLVADVGVGVGHYALHLAQRGCQIHLVDLAERLLEATQARFRKAGLPESIIGTTHTSATDLSALPVASFDAVLLLGPLYHLCSLTARQQAIAEAYRLLKPGGLIFAAGINRLAYLRAAWDQNPQSAKANESFWQGYVNDGLLDPDHAPPLGYAHLTTVAELQGLFQDNFTELLLAGIESFTGHAQKQLLKLSAAEREIWLDVVEATSTTPEGYGPAEHLLYVGRKQQGKLHN